MNNKITGIIVDAGHGGIDSGAVGNNLEEKDLTLRAAKYIYNRLNELEIRVNNIENRLSKYNNKDDDDSIYML